MTDRDSGFRVTMAMPGVAVLTLNRPDRRNSLPWRFWRDFGRALRDLDEAGTVRAAVVEAEGPHFSAGMAFDFFRCSECPPGMDAGRFSESLRHVVLDLQQAVATLEQVRFPVIAAIQGGCIGAGLDLVCAATLRLCADDGYFQAAEVEMGLAPDMGTLQRLPLLIPPGLAAELALTGRPMPAKEALRHGFVTEIAPDAAALRQAALALAGRLAAKSPLAVAGIKAGLLFARDHGVGAGLGLSAAWNAGMFVTGDVAASVAARRDRSQPAYADLNPRTADWLLEAGAPKP
ncbi:enoyl-CoA hydratase-related protein [Zavarzinia compransoris]|uniref:enoyl-CoA hydratase-related protein n=1 Tax=Zavarzinia marina TaxID=2911065 RepID=UPI001F455E30|nr:enoyl-CoA hydratase-related protein [Zavarzinia marina]MCF4167297.1 enoyl-CoA hydratase-related protein [Zavarzinia marina]